MGVDGGDRVIRPRITMSLNFTSLALACVSFLCPIFFIIAIKIIVKILFICITLPG